MRKFTKKEVKKLKKYWNAFQSAQEEFESIVIDIEEDMQKDLNIDDLEFFKSDDGYCGIGNVSRTIKLIYNDELEK